MSDEFQSAAAALRQEEGNHDAHYTPGSGAAAPGIRVGRSYNLELTDTYGTVIEVQIAVTLLRSDVGIPSPGDQVVIDPGTPDEITYRIERVVSYDDYMVTVSCSNGTG